MGRRGELFSRSQSTPPTVGEHRRVPGTPRLHVGVLTWASSALHTSCSLSGVMSTGTSNGEPNSWPPSSWNCTSSRCTSPAAASSCGNKPGGSQCLPLPPSGLGTPHGDPRVPALCVYTHRHSVRHPASPRGGKARRRDGAPRPGRPAAAGHSALCCSEEKIKRANDITRRSPRLLLYPSCGLSHFTTTGLVNFSRSLKLKRKEVDWPTYLTGAGNGGG